MKRLHVLAPTAVTVVVFIVLAITQNDPWGEDLPTIIQASMTAALLGVTISYVIATQALAQAASDDLKLTRETPMRQACDELWSVVNDHYETLMMSSLFLERSFDEGPVTGGQYTVLSQVIDGFTDATRALCREVTRLMPQLPPSVYEAARELNGRASEFWRLAPEWQMVAGEVINAQSHITATVSHAAITEAWQRKTVGQPEASGFDVKTTSREVFASVEALQAASFIYGK